MSDDELSRINKYLGLNDIDARLKIKADCMKKTLKYASIWHRGSKQAWIDKLANRTGLSTRKVRENYIEPLITEGILREYGNGEVEFVGLPENAEMPIEIQDQENQIEKINRLRKEKEKQ